MASSSQVRDGQIEVREGDAAVDLEGLAGQVAACGGGEIDGGSGDVLRITEAAHRCHLLHGGAQLVVGGDDVERGGEDGARCDRVDPDARAEVQRGQPGVVRECGFGGAGGAAAAAGQASHGRGDVDDAA